MSVLTRTAIVIAFFCMSLLFVAEAQVYNPQQSELGGGRVFLSLGLDPAVQMTLGYSHDVDCFNRTLRVGYDLTLPAGKADLNDLRLRWWSIAPLLGEQDWRVQGIIGLSAVTTENDTYDGISFGMDLGAQAGMYKPDWSVAAEFGFTKSMFTHVSHNDWYRDYIYADAKDGWYGGAGGVWRFGLAASYSFDPVDLELRGGLRTGEGEGMLIPPMYLTLGAAYNLN